MHQAGVRAWIPAVSAAMVGRPERAVWAWVFLGLVLRMTLALTTFGTNDVLAWDKFMTTIVATDWVRVYHLVPEYNHPPLMSLYLKLIHPWLGTVPNGLSMLIRLPAILADIGTAFLMVRLAQEFYDNELAGRAAAIVSLTPLLVLVSGYHGNTDPLFVFLFLLAAERVLIGDWRFRAGLILGLSLGVKIVPLMLFPIFFFWLPTGRQRIRFFLGAALAAGAIFGYHLLADFAALYRNVLSYDSTHGVWGYTQFLKPLGLWPPFMRLPAKLLLLGGIVFAAFRHTRGRRGEPKALLEGIGLTFLVFLILSPGFGIQYLSWLVAPGLFLMVPKETARFHFWSGVLAFSAYNHWCHGEPLESLAGSVRWNPWELVLCFIIWVVLIRWLVQWTRLQGRRGAA
jgi:hypothetical protein